MNEQGLFLDLRRIVDGAMESGLHSGTVEHGVYVVDQAHRMHTVCSTLEALGYTRRVRGAWINDRAKSGWQLTPCGIDLYSELAAQRAARGIKA